MIIRIAALLLALAGTTVQADQEEPLFEYQGKSYAVKDLSARMQQLHGTVLHDHYKTMRTLIDEMLFDVYVEQEAARQQRPVREVGMELLAVPDPTESEIRNFYDQMQARINLPFDQISKRLGKELKRQRVLQQRARLITRLKSEGKFALLLPMPPPALVIIDTTGRPLRGQPSAPITDALLKKYPQDIKLVFMDFPINPSGISRQVAYGGVCAQNQGKFWAYHDAAFKSQASLSKESPGKIARQVGVPMDKFEQCMQDRGTRAKVQASADEARRLGVTATPTLFVDGRPFPSNHLLRDLGAYIEKKKAGQP